MVRIPQSQLARKNFSRKIVIENKSNGGNIMNKHVIIIYLFFSLFCFSIGNSQNWQQVWEIDSTQVYSIINHDEYLFAVTGDQVFRSTDDGASWQLTENLPTATSDFYTIYSYGQNLYLGARGDGVFVSADSGKTWQSHSAGLSGFAKSIAGFTGQGDSLYAGTEAGVYVLNLINPVIWTAFNSGLFHTSVNSINSIGNKLFLSAGYYLYARSKNESQWNIVTPDTSSEQRIVYETLFHNDYIFAGTEKGIFRGTSDAMEWKKTDIKQFQNRDITALTAYRSRIIAGLIYRGEHWIFTSDDSGLTWEIQAHEFAWLTDLYVSENRLWACRSDGLWYIDINSWNKIKTNNNPVSSEYVLYQNFPNPFNPSTTIGYHIQVTGTVRLTIYNVLGQKVKTLVNTIQNKGVYSVHWDGTDDKNIPVGSGMYMYQLQTNTHNLQKKMLLLR
ncbi:MAG: T9SS type A sorting domain-containing protein [Calditrichaceae bacterium]|nr:T9SS type A sorting domain-containing protein [Calditrichaceae bacterium]MBN2708905.1 T9SS type A sorting domain-containing protein [Calditrichaceae bacterium]